MRRSDVSVNFIEIKKFNNLNIKKFNFNMALKSLEKIKELDVLSFPLLAGVEVLSMRGRRTKKQAVDYLKEKEIGIGFSRYSSSIEKACLKSFGVSSSHASNFTLYFDIKNAEVTANHTHFYRNENWKGLDYELKKEVRVLRELGFNINYKGYLKERDISI